MRRLSKARVYSCCSARVVTTVNLFAAGTGIVLRHEILILKIHFNSFFKTFTVMFAFVLRHDVGGHSISGSHSISKQNDRGSEYFEIELPGVKN